MTEIEYKEIEASIKICDELSSDLVDCLSHLCRDYDMREETNCIYLCKDKRIKNDDEFVNYLVNRWMMWHNANSEPILFEAFMAAARLRQRRQAIFTVLLDLYNLLIEIQRHYDFEDEDNQKIQMLLFKVKAIIGLGPNR